MKKLVLAVFLLVGIAAMAATQAGSTQDGSTQSDDSVACGAASIN